MVAAALVTSSLEEAFEVGLRCIPRESRLAHSLRKVKEEHKNLNASEALEAIHSRWDETRQHDWRHSISNAEVVAWALLHGGGEFERSVCMAVEAGFDTDCNAATVGSILGAILGARSLDGTFAAQAAIHPVHTGVRGVPEVAEDEFVQRTMNLLAQRMR
jgi:ADP-ribosylglycohydrolase